MELNAGQMIEDVRLAVEGKLPVEHYGRLGGIVPDPSEVWDAMKEKLNIEVSFSGLNKDGKFETVKDEQLDEVISNLNKMVP